MRKALWVSFFLGPIFFFFLLSVVKKQPQRPSASPPYPEVASKWAALHYAPIDNSDSFKERIDLIPIESNFSLSGPQRGVLKQSVYNALRAFHEGTYEAYREFRTPVQARFNLDLIKAEKEYFGKYLKRPGEAIPADPEAFFRILWERSSGGDSWSNSWQGLSFESVKINVTNSTAIPMGLFAYAQTRDNIGVFRPNPNFIFERTPESILKDHGNLIFATVYLVIKHQEPDPPYGKYLRYYWDEVSGKWLPWEYVSVFLKKREHEILW